MPRRGFLRALAALPLIGGGITLFGQPVAAAAPVSLDLLRRYHAFLSHESFAARVEIELMRSPWAFHDRGLSLDDPDTWRGEPWWWPVAENADVLRCVTRTPASTRAAVVLSAAAVPLRQVGAPA